MHDIIEVIETKASTAPAQSRHLLGHIKQMFAWSVASGKYGLSVSPAQLVSALAIIGKKKRRSRVLNDEELRSVWNAATKLHYPYGDAIRMLILTGQRKSEVGDATWSEFDLRKRLWIIPKARMKMDHDHLVPLTEDMLALLDGLLRFASGDHLFSTTYGARPANGYSKAKERLDKLTGPLPHWTIHDLRRTFRTNLSAFPQIPDRVREVMIAHNSGMHAIYDLHTYEAEKRQGFGLWNARLRGIIAPPDDASNVVPIRG